MSPVINHLRKVWDAVRTNKILIPYIAIMVTLTFWLFLRAELAR